MPFKDAGPPGHEATAAGRAPRITIRGLVAGLFGDQTLDALGACLKKLEAALLRDIRAVAARGGFYDQMRLASPQCELSLDALTEEKGKLLGELRAMAGRLGAPPGLLPQPCPDQVRGLALSLRRHDRAEKRLVHQVYWLDIGGNN